MRELAAENLLAKGPVVPYQELGFCVSVDFDVSVGDGSLLAAAAYQPRTGDSLSLCGARSTAAVCSAWNALQVEPGSLWATMSSPSISPISMHSLLT